MPHYLRTNYRIQGDLIDTAYYVYAAGSSATSAAADKIGSVEIAHGMGTTPAFAYAAPICADTLAAVGRRIGVLNMGATNITFVTVSALVNASLDLTAITSAMSSSVIMTFVWAAGG